MAQLSPSRVKAVEKKGRYADGNGLYLLVDPNGGKSWLCRVQKHGRRRDIGLGSASKVTLAQARQRAAEVRSWVEMALDPVYERRKAAGRRLRDRSLFDLPIDSKLRGCDFVKIRIGDLVTGGPLRSRATRDPAETGRPVQFEIMAEARKILRFQDLFDKPI